MSPFKVASENFACNNKISTQKILYNIFKGKYNHWKYKNFLSLFKSKNKRENEKIVFAFTMGKTNFAHFGGLKNINRTEFQIVCDFFIVKTLLRAAKSLLFTYIWYRKQTNFVASATYAWQFGFYATIFRLFVGTVCGSLPQLNLIRLPVTWPSVFCITAGISVLSNRVQTHENFFLAVFSTVGAKFNYSSLNSGQSYGIIAIVRQSWARDNFLASRQRQRDNSTM